MMNKRKRVSGQIISLQTAKGTESNGIAAHEAEAAIIGAVLREPLVFASSAEYLQPADFYTLFYGYCWYAFEQIVNRGEGIDLITLADELTTQGQWYDGAMGRLAALTADAPNPENADAYARQVRESATCLRVMAAADQIQRTILNRQQSLEQRIDECNRVLFEATDQQIRTDDTSMAAIMGRYFDTVEQNWMQGVRPSFPTGYHNLDNLYAGAARGEVTVIAGGEGMGKTTFSLNLIRNAAMLGLRIAIFTLEMSKDEIALNFMAMEAGIPKVALKNYTLEDEQWSRFSRGSGIIAGWQIHVIDEYPTLTPIQLRRRLHRLLLDMGIDLVLIDGLWLMEDSGGETDRPRAVGNITRDLAQIARDFNVGIYITHQYNGEAWNRAKDDKQPKLYDLAESAGVRRNAHTIWGLYRNSYYSIQTLSDVTELHILKDRSRSGLQGRHVEFMFNLGNNQLSEVR